MARSDRTDITEGTRCFGRNLLGHESHDAQVIYTAKLAGCGACAVRHAARGLRLAARQRRIHQVVGDQELHPGGGGGGTSMSCLVRSARRHPDARAYEVARAHKRAVYSGAPVSIEADSTAALVWLHQRSVVGHVIDAALGGTDEEKPVSKRHFAQRSCGILVFLPAERVSRPGRQTGLGVRTMCQARKERSHVFR